MEQELIDPSANDPASKAFDRLRREVTTLRLAVEHLADAPGKIEIPDYTETLARMDGRISQTHKALRTLADRPAVALTPEALAQQIASAGVDARRVEQAAFDKATATFVTLGRELSSLTASARSASEQFRHQLWTGVGGIVFGAFVATLLPTVTVKLAPESWHWPEKRAAYGLGSDMWQAGQRIMAAADPDEWNAIADTSRAVKDSRGVIAKCLKVAKVNRKQVPCLITVKSTGSE